jgi:hypothetical protein
MTTIRRRFNKAFFSDIHTRLVENLSGQIQIKLSEQDDPYIDEFFVQEKAQDIIERRSTKIDDSIKVVRNKAHKPLKTKVMELTGKTFNAQFDIRVLGNDYKVLYAVYEIKSRLRKDRELIPTSIYKDIQRLAIVKAVYPQVKCIFLLPGISEWMESDFKRAGIILPHKFDIANNPNFKRKGRYVNTNLEIGVILAHRDILEALGVKEISLRLSQTFKGRNHLLLTHEINIK